MPQVGEYKAPRVGNDQFAGLIRTLEENGWVVEINDRSTWGADSEFKARYGDPNGANYVFHVHQSQGIMFRENIGQYAYEINIAAEPWLFILRLLDRWSVMDDLLGNIT